MESKKILLVTKKSPVTKESPLVKESPVTKESPIAKASAVAREPSTSNSLPSVANSSATVPINPSASVANSSALVPIIPSASVPINPPLIPAGRRVAARRSQPPVRSWLRTLRPRPMVDGSNINDLVNNSYYINDSNSHNINDNDLVNNNEFNDTDGIQEVYFEKKFELDGETDEQVVNDVDPNPDQIESKIDEVGSVANGYNEMTDNSLDHQGPILQN